MFNQLFLLTPNLKPSLDSIFFKTEARGKTVWKVTSRAMKGSSAPFSSLVTVIRTYRQGLKFCFFAAASSRLREGAAVWWPAVGYVLNGNPPAKQGDEPWWESPWALSKEQGELRAARGPQQYRRARAKGRDSFWSARPSCDVHRLVFLYVSATACPLFPSQASCQESDKRAGSWWQKPPFLLAAGHNRNGAWIKDGPSPFTRGRFFKTSQN